MNLRFGMKHVDILLLLFGIILVTGCLTRTPQKLDFVPDVIRGLTAIAGILAGFITFSLSNLIKLFKEKENKGLLHERIVFTVTLMGLGLVMIFSAYGDLADGFLVRSFRWASMGFAVMLLLFLDAIFLLAFTEN